MYINELRVQNYRSLKNVIISGLKNTVVFHGANSAGKSNILSLLETIFKRKLKPDEVEGVVNRPLYFWRGLLDGCADDFYKNNSTKINFTVDMRFSAGELSGYLRNVDSNIQVLLKKGQGREDRLMIKGEIQQRAGGSSAYFEVKEISLNPRGGTPNIAYRQTASAVEHFPAQRSVGEAERLKAFEQLMEPLHDCVKVVSSHRYVSPHEEFPKEANSDLTSYNFKGWLYNLSMDRDKFARYSAIVDLFNSAPFNYGRISFAKVVPNEIEIMVEKDGLRLPINRVGSGLRQVLFLIACILESKGKIVGVEELEINLSPKLQNQLVAKLRQYCSRANPLFHQLLITSHSEKFSYKRTELKSFSVEYKNDQTEVKHMTNRAMRQYYNDVIG